MFASEQEINFNEKVAGSVVQTSGGQEKAPSPQRIKEVVASIGSELHEVGKGLFFRAMAQPHGMASLFSSNPNASQSRYDGGDGQCLPKGRQ